MGQMTGGELLLKCLKVEGVDTLFGVLDGSYNPFLAKLKDYGMRLIAPRHEEAAANMADAYARITGRPAVVVGGIGPGASNLLSGVITAYAEGTPLIVITGQRRRNIIYPDRGGSFQNVPLLDLYRPVTKWSAGVRDWRRIPELVRKAYRAATSGRPGPVYLEIPEDVLRETNEADKADVWAPSERYHGKLGLGDPESIEKAAELLAGAKRPFLHAGTGVAWAGAWDEFRALADYLSAGVTTSLGARGVFPEDHPRFLHPLDFEALEAARSEADVVLVVGSRLGELEHWGKPPFWGDPASQKLIQIDADPTTIGLNRPVDLGIVGDAKAALSAILEGVKRRTEPKPENPDWKRYRELSRSWQQQKKMALNQEGESGLNPGKMVQTVREFFPRDAITVMDGGNTSLWTASFNPIYEPRSYLYTAKFGHLGTGLPYALGAKLAAPDRQGYLITGDGALGFNIQELETASRYNLPIVVIVAVDRGWGMERSSQVFAGLEGMVATELNPAVRYDKVAEALGCHGETVESQEELLPALERSAESGKPALIQAMVDPTVNMAPPGLVEFGSMVYRAED